MDCKNARLLLEFIHPGSAELDSAEAEALHQHLGECPDCAAQAREERRADEHLGRAMRDVPVPDGLRERVLKRLTIERDAWYRRWIRRWLVRGVAAAAVIAGLWVGYLTLFNRLPALSRDDVLRLADGPPLDRRREVEEGLNAVPGSPIPVPSQYNYELLRSFGMKILRGKTVPYLRFVSPSAERDRPPDEAHVYIITSRQFDLETTMRNIGTLSAGDHFSVNVSFSPDMDAIYLVFFRGDGGLNKFFKNNPH
jgi:hypothetical protein